MKNKLVIVDLQYMFHRHKYRVQQFEEKNGTYMMNDSHGRETARLYFTLKDLAAILSTAARNGEDIVICMDSKSERKEENTDYKANRHGLGELDAAALDNIEYVIRKSELPVMKEAGFEADDLVGAVIRNRYDEYEHILVYTPDADLCVYVDDKVSILRYKSVYSKRATFLAAHAVITKETFSGLMSDELKTQMPYNAIMLYKCTVGDKSDNIKGITGFGPAAFGKFICNVAHAGVDITKLTTAEEVERVLNLFRPNLGDKGVNEALASLELVKGRTNEEIESNAKNLSISIPDMNKFRAACIEFDIKSL